MSTVLRLDPYRFFYAGDRNEPPHIHVERDANLAKFWLEPLRIARVRGFNRKEIDQIQNLVEAQEAYLLRREMV